MPLNIKDEDVHRTARAIAALTGESITTAVKTALADRLAQLKAQDEGRPGRSAERLMTLARECAATLHATSHSSDHADLYGDDGMPK